MDAAEAFAVNIRNRNLALAQGSFAAAWTAEWAFTVALAVIAFRDGGATLVGLIVLLRMLPAGLLGPVLSVAADRMRRESILLWIGLARAVTIGLGAAVLELGGPTWPVYALALLATIVAVPFRAAHSALLPSLCTRPEELTSANVVRGLLDSLSMLIGPLAAAALLELGSASGVLIAAAVASLLSALATRPIRYERPPRMEPVAERRRFAAEAMEGLRAIAARPDVALVIALATSQAFIRGALNVFMVVVAIDLLDMGEPGTGVLAAAVGAGAVVGSLAATMLINSRRLAQIFGLGVALWGLPFVLLGVFPSEGSALVLLAIVGVGNALVDVGFFSVMMRLVPDEVLARVFGALEALVAIAVALGSIATPLAIALVDIEGALIVLGVVGPVGSLLALRRLRRIDGGLLALTAKAQLLRRVEMFRPLPLATLEHLARHLESRSYEPGEYVCRQGTDGDEFHVIASGAAEVLKDGSLVREIDRGEGFGEIALLKTVPRTCDVRASEPLTTYSLSSRRLVSAISGFGAASSAAELAMALRLAEDRAREQAGEAPAGGPALPPQPA